MRSIPHSAPMQNKKQRFGSRVAKMLLDGKAPREIIRALGVCGATVAYHRRRLGMPKNRTGRPSGIYGVEASLRVAEMRSAGMTFQQIGDKMGLTRQSAQARMVKLAKAMGDSK